MVGGRTGRERLVRRDGDRDGDPDRDEGGDEDSDDVAPDVEGKSRRYCEGKIDKATRRILCAEELLRVA